MKKTLLILATLLWIGFWWRWYTCKICETCGCDKLPIPAAVSIPPESGVLLFNKNDSIALVQIGWANYRDSLLASLLSNQKITIEGQYLANEPNNSSFADMGLARAHAISKLFPDSLQTRIKLSSAIVGERSSMDIGPWLAHKINLITESEKIEEISNNKSLVYFSYNSDQRLEDQVIEDYLSKMALDNSNARSSFNITGHTDSQGPADENVKLGLARANAIKKFLIKRGIEANRITTKSMGESNPIESNDTKEGRQKNRRTEIEIINKQ